MGLLDEEFLTVADVAELLKLNQRTVRNWIDAGYLKAFDVGRRVRILRSDLEALLEQSRTGVRPADEASRSPDPAQAFWEGDAVPGRDAPPEGG